jgi:hypothetical protein
MDTPECITSLPETSDAIAAVLDAKGIKGFRAHSHCCPIANLVRSEVGCHYLEIGGAWADIVIVKGDDADAFDIPQRVVNFVSRFDMGDYPNLIEGTWII